MFILENTVNHGIKMQPYHSYFIGPMDICSALITSSGTINTFGVRFRPCGLSRFMKISLSELTTRSSGLSAAGGAARLPSAGCGDQ